MFSDHDETSPSIAEVSDLSVACSMLAVQQQKRLCCQLLVDVSAARRGCHTMKLTYLDRPGIYATGVRRSEIYSGVCKGKGKRGFV